MQENGIPSCLKAANSESKTCLTKVVQCVFNP